MTSRLRLLVLVPALLSATACYEEDDYYSCCDAECGYYVSVAPSRRVPSSYGGMFFSQREYEDCPANQVKRAHFCDEYWGGYENQVCAVEAYWGSDDGDGATIQAVASNDDGRYVTATVTVTIPGTGIWAEPAVLAIAGPNDASYEASYGGASYHDLIVYPGGVNFTHVFERKVVKQNNIRFGLVRVHDPRVAYKIGATQSREVQLNRPRVWASLGSAK